MNKFSQILLFPFLILLFSCDGMIKELDIDVLSFPPKLSVTALLDGEYGILDISIMEGLSIADYETYKQQKEDIRNGEIRLYEDARLIWSRQGPFDMSRKIEEYGDVWGWGKSGYRGVFREIGTRPGGVYRLEVELEGCPKAVSSSAMPVAPVVSATMDTSVQMIRKHVKEIGMMGHWLYLFGNRNFLDNNPSKPDKYWPVTISIPNQGQYVLDIRYWSELTDNTSIIAYNWGIGGLDASILLENGMDRLLTNLNEVVDLYMFSLLMTNDFNFSGKYNSRTFYAAVPENQNNNSDFEGNPDYEKVTRLHSLELRVKHITPATYRYSRGMMLQWENSGMLSSEPVNIVGNMENGYGIFSVYNTTSIKLLEWETHEYR